jgi:cation-transporting ATPase E
LRDVSQTARPGLQSGLSASDVADRVARGQVNDVPAASTRTVWRIVRDNVFTRFNALLGTMLVLILLTGSTRDALFGIVMVANSAIGIVQELRAKRALDRLAVLTAPRANVLRDGQQRDVAVGEVVLDDVVRAAIGNQIVVDGTVLDVQGLQIDESLLTGESDPILKAPGDEALSGSFVVAGSGSYRATRVGRDSYAASLAEDARRFTPTKSELRDGINRILKYISWAIVPTGILLFWSQLRVQAGWRSAISGAVAGTVAMVPEGLVLLMNVAFAAAVVRLSRRRVLVQELPAVEGLARIDVLCIDKTGTLTEGSVDVISVETLAGATTAEVEAALAAIAANDASPNATMHAIAERFPHGSRRLGHDGRRAVLLGA